MEETGMRGNALTWPQRGRLWMRLGIRLLLAVLGILGVVKLLPVVLSLFAPFLLAVGMASLLNPVVRWLQRKLSWSRSLTALATVLLLVGLVVGGLVLLAYGLGSEVVSLARNWEGLFGQAVTGLEELERLFARFQSLVPAEITLATQALVDKLVAWIQGNISSALASSAEYITNKAVGIPAFFLALVMFLMATYFLSAEYPYLRTRMIQHTDDRLLIFLAQLKKTVMAAFGGYLKAQVLLSVGVFFILLAGFLLVGQSYALLLALGLAILDFIPLLGSGTVMIPWAVFAFLTRSYPTAISVILIWSVIAVFRRVAEPKIVGDQTGLSPVLSLVSIYVGMKLAGVTGMILGPIMVLVVLNLAGIGMFRNLRLDVTAAVEDVVVLLRPEAENF